MKRHLFLVLLLSIILVACSADDTEQNSEKDAQIEKQDDIAQVEEKDKTEENVDNKELEEEYNPFFAIGNITLNKRDIVLHEVENGKVILVGEKLQNGSAKIAVRFTGNLQRVWKNIEPSLKIITDDGNDFSNFSTETRMAEDGLYILYNFSDVTGKSIARIDFSINKKNKDVEVQKFVLEETNQTMEVPGLIQYISSPKELPVLKDSYKTIAFKEITYGDHALKVKADVTYNEDVKLKATNAYLYNPFTEESYKSKIENEYFAGIPKEINLKFDVGFISQHSPYVHLMLLDRKINLSLFSGKSYENEMKIVSLPNENVTDQLFTNLLNAPSIGVQVPSESGLTDILGNTYYNAKSIMVPSDYTGALYRDQQLVKLYSDEFSTFTATLSIKHDNRFVNQDIKVYFVADDLKFGDNGKLLEPDFSGTILKELTLTPNEIQEVTFETKGSSVIHIISARTESAVGYADIIIADGKFNK